MNVNKSILCAATVFSLALISACGGDSNDTDTSTGGGGVHKEPTTEQIANMLCDTQYAPVCGLSDVHYKTYSNSCVADTHTAQVVFSGGCGSLEGQLSSGDTPVLVQSVLPQKVTDTLVSYAEIEGDILKVELAYTGCNDAVFSLVASSLFMESNPVQSAYVFYGSAGECATPQIIDLIYDLTPLKHVYQSTYQSTGGEIILPGLGNYIF